jgi:hypothetical protein
MMLKSIPQDLVPQNLYSNFAADYSFFTPSALLPFDGIGTDISLRKKKEKNGDSVGG